MRAAKEQAGDYVLGDKIGRGRTGVVFKATHRSRPGQFAVKVLRRALAGEESKHARLRRLAEEAGRLSHPNIGQIYEFGETSDGGSYMVMELCEGVALDALLRERPRLPLDVAVELLVQVCQALAHAHAQGVIHRDLKPGNMMVAMSGPSARDVKVKVLDFDMARYLGTGRSGGALEERLTTAWELVGTAGYMSPEQIGHYEVDPRSDLYSLGCIAYELLVGAPPFDGDPWAVTLAHASKPVPAPSTQGVSLPAALEALVLACLAKTPEDRPDSAEAVLDELARLSRGLSCGCGSSASTRPNSRPTLPAPRGPGGLSRASCQLAELHITGHRQHAAGLGAAARPVRHREPGQPEQRRSGPDQPGRSTGATPASTPSGRPTTAAPSRRPWAAWDPCCSSAGGHFAYEGNCVVRYDIALRTWELLTQPTLTGTLHSTGNLGQPQRGQRLGQRPGGPGRSVHQGWDRRADRQHRRRAATRPPTGCPSPSTPTAASPSCRPTRAAGRSARWSSSATTRPASTSLSANGKAWRLDLQSKLWSVVPYAFNQWYSVHACEYDAQNKVLWAFTGGSDKATCYSWLAGSWHTLSNMASINNTAGISNACFMPNRKLLVLARLDGSQRLEAIEVSGYVHGTSLSLPYYPLNVSGSGPRWLWDSVPERRGARQAGVLVVRRLPVVRRARRADQPHHHPLQAHPAAGRAREHRGLGLDQRDLDRPGRRPARHHGLRRRLPPARLGRPLPLRAGHQVLPDLGRPGPAGAGSAARVVHLR